MGLSPDEVLKIVARLTKKIASRLPAINRELGYYTGADGRLRFATEEFKDFAGKRFEGFSDNWCQPVAQAPVERMRHQGIILPGELAINSTLANIFERNDAQLGLSEALTVMTVARRAFALVSRTDSGARISFEHPDSAVVDYDALTGKRTWGLAFWEDDTAEYARLYSPYSTIKAKRPKVELVGGSRVMSASTGWGFDSAADGTVEQSHGFGSVPLVEFRNQSLLDDQPISDIELVISMQDAMNLVWQYLMSALDFVALPGRVITNGDMPKEDILDDEGNKIGERPVELDALLRDRIAWLEGQGIKIDEWGVGNVDAFEKIIAMGVQHIAAQTRTPAHYLLNSTNVPATGFEAAEAALTSKASARIGYANPSLKEVYRLSAIAEGLPDLAALVPGAQLRWAKPQLRSEAQLMDGLIKLRQAGFPFEFIAEEYGLAPNDVSRILEMRDREMEADLSLIKEPVNDSGIDGDLL